MIKHIASHISFTIFAWLILAQLPIVAQPGLEIIRVENNFPDIKVTLRAMCNHSLKTNLQPGDFQIRENGISLGVTSLSCPQVTPPCCVSASLIFDRSGSMAGQKLSDAKSAGKTFVQGMDGFCDQAAIIAFDAAVSIVQSSTPNRPILISAIDNIQTGGGSAVWDGAYVGVQELVDHGSGECKIAILLTDGEDNASSRVVDDVIALASSGSIKVITIGLDVSGQYENDLQRLAQLTGGRYYKALTSSELKDIFLTIQGEYFKPKPECVLTYRTSCADGMQREIDVTLDICGSSVTRTVQYVAPLDTGRTLESAVIKVGEEIAGANQEVQIPLTLQSLISEPFQPSSFLVSFDDRCMEFVQIVTTSYLFDKIPFTWKIIPGGVELTMKKGVFVPSLGVLAMLRFRAKDPDTDIACPITLTGWNFNGGGCVKTVTLAGALHVISRKPAITCDLDLPSELRWDVRLKDYVPNPFAVTAILRNSGDREARNPKCTITINGTNVDLFNSPKTIDAVPPIIPRDVGEAYATWELKSLRRYRGDTITICVRTTFDNHQTVTCCKKLFIPPTGAIIQCGLLMPEIRADKNTNTYSPMPFTITAEITNIGGLPSDSIDATIMIPAEFSLVGADQFQPTKRTNPGILFPGVRAVLTWTLTHPVISENRTYYIGVCTRSKNMDTTCCAVEVHIPGLSVPELHCAITIPDSIVYDDLGDRYVPNPFPITVSIKNTGILDADSAWAKIILPPELELEPVNQSQQRFFSPMRVTEWNDQLPPNQLTWLVRAKKQVTYTCVRVAFQIAGYDAIGHRFHISTCEKLLCIPPHYLTPMACFISAPAMLDRDTTQTEYIPNPLTVWATIMNTGKRRLDSARATIILPPNEGLTLVQGELPTKLGAPWIDPGNSVLVGWNVRIQEKGITRLPLLRVRTFVKNSNVLDTECEWKMEIPPLKVALSCVASGPDTIRYSRTSQNYFPNPFDVALSLANSSGKRIDSIDCSMTLPPELELTPGERQQKTISTIASGALEKTLWNIRLVKALTAKRTVRILFTYRQNGLDEYQCPLDVAIEPAEQASFACTLSAPDSIRKQNGIFIPDPFNIDFEISNVGNIAARNVRAYILQSNRFDVLTASDLLLKDTCATGEKLASQFTLRVKPGNGNITDTLRIMITADEATPTLCERLIFIDGESSADIHLQCVTTADTVRYNTALHDYAPSPLSIVATIENRGQSIAGDCTAYFISTSGFTLYQSPATISLGDLRMNERAQAKFSVRALRHQTASHDTLRLRIQYRDQGSNEIIERECQLVLFVERAFDASFDLKCASIPELVFVDSMYVPQSFRFDATITNRSQSSITNLPSRITIPAGMILSTTDSLTKVIPALQSNESATLTWNLLPEKVIPTSMLNVCVTTTGSEGDSLTCCSSISVVKSDGNDLLLSCSGIDSLRIDAATGDYTGNPFQVRARVTNRSAVPLDSVMISAIPLDAKLALSWSEAKTKLAAASLAQVSTTELVWTILASKTKFAGYAAIRFLASAKNIPPIDCTTSVFIPASIHEQIDARCTVTPSDTLHYLLTEGRYAEDPFAFTLRVSNPADFAVHNLSATLIVPAGISLASGEISQKSLGKPYLLHGDSASLTWKLHAIRPQSNTVKIFSVQLRADNARSQECSSSLIIEGARLEATLTIERTLFGKAGEMISVPIIITGARGKGITSASMILSFDSSVISFVNYDRTHTLIERDWAEPFVQKLSPDRVLINAYTSGQPLAVDSGAFLHLHFFGSYARADVEPFSASTPIRFDSVQFNRGDIVATNSDGFITITGKCIAPLQSDKAFQLFTNEPNPFGEATVFGNPQTSISFSLPKDSFVRLRVFDQLGRVVVTLIDRHVAEGIHRVDFDGSSMSGGVYYCRLETAFGVRMMKMVYRK